MVWEPGKSVLSPPASLFCSQLPFPPCISGTSEATLNGPLMSKNVAAKRQALVSFNLGSLRTDKDCLPGCLE